MEEITTETHRLITDTDENLIYDDNGQNVLIQRISDENFIYANADVIFQKFNIQNNDNMTSETEQNQRTTWCRSEIISLIELYKEHEGQFKSTTVKNDKVWQTISNKINTRTWEQCKNKFKYLKSKYMEKKDNMSAKSSGAKAIKFEFYEEMDKIFGRQPNVNPVAIASSSRGIANITSTCLSQEEIKSIDTDNNIKRCAKEPAEKEDKKKRKLNEGIYKEVQEMKEEGRNKRHKEKMDMIRELTRVIKEGFNTFKSTE